MEKSKISNNFWQPWNMLTSEDRIMVTLTIASGCNYQVYTYIVTYFIRSALLFSPVIITPHRCTYLFSYYGKKVCMVVILCKFCLFFY